MKRLPVGLVWTKPHDSLGSARSRDNQLKRWNDVKKTSLVGDFLDHARDTD
ncbi:MAG TPA: hypothetical protein VMF66_16300 [Candidatus Acidoferrum sp.]|nr:hypothetical protein [Candidatus Acidoferrum sp.]